MRTATTLHRTSDGWVLASGPDKPADKQRLAFNNIGSNWPKDVLEVRFQQGDGPAKTKDREKAQAAHQQLADAEKRAKEKLKTAEEREQLMAERTKKQEEERKKAADAARAAEVKAKEASKAAALKQQPPKPSTK